MLSLLAILVASQTETVKSETVVLPFIKLDTLGVNPLNTKEKIVFNKDVVEKMTKEFKEAPVYIVTYKEVDKNKIESKFEQVGTASCVFVSEGWINASIKIKKPIPNDYVLRARTQSSQNKFRNEILEVQAASVIEFYLKPKEMAVEFK